MLTVSGLTTEQITQLNKVLQVLEPAQLVVMTDKILEVEAVGMGEVYIVVRGGRPTRVGVRCETSLPRQMYLPE